MKRAMVAGGVSLVILLAALAQQGMTLAQQKSMSDEGGRILALEKAWNRALEVKDAKALDMLLANTLVSVDIDGSVASKSEFLASIKAPDYQPAQVVTEQTSVQVYGNAGVVTGVFRVKGTENGKQYVRRERFTDTWIKMGDQWQCVASQTTLIPGK
jgi:ketosteroid isomerase-like protein